jgi:histidine kinase
MGKTRSIRVTAVILSLAMLFIPLGLILIVGSTLSGYHQGRSNLLTEVINPRPPFIKLARITEESERRINMQMIEDPTGLADEEFLNELDPDIEALGLLVRVGDEIVYSSESVARNEEGDRLARMLPPYGQLGRGFPIGERVGRDRDRFSLFQIMSQWDFRSESDEPGSLFILQNVPRDRPWPAQTFGAVVALGAIALLVIANGALSFFLISRMLKPMRRLEHAALAMGEGRFDEPVPPPQVREVTHVFAAFETMRSRLKELLERRRQDEESRHELIAGLSHDLKTPVTAMKGYVEGLRDGVADTPEKRERYIGTIHRKIGVLEKMISELFLLASLQVREAPFAFRTVNLADFLRDSVEEFHATHTSGEQRVLSENLDRGDVTIYADPVQLRRAVENVLENALTHGGSESLEVRVGLSLREHWARITIRDDGRGIPADQVSRVFESSFRGDAARSKSGSGLGLTIARRIIELHGGVVHVESTVGEGTTVTMDLPRGEHEQDPGH